MTMSFEPKKQIGVGDYKVSEKELEYLSEVLSSGRLTYGPFSEKFERLFAKLHDCKHAIFCNSGTSALHISVAALKEIHHWEDGDEILIPAVTFIATSNVILHNNLKPVFVDVEKDTYNINPNEIKKHITNKTRAIIPVHLFGQPASMNIIEEIANDNNLSIIEDSAETICASQNGQSVGSFGDFGCFSTYSAHILVTGVGGMITTNNDLYAVVARSIMNHGRNNIYLNIDDDKNKTEEQLNEIVDKRFQFVRLGHSFRATEMEAAIGLSQLENISFNINKRRENAKYLTHFLEKYKSFIQLPIIKEDRDHSFMMYPIVLINHDKSKMVHFLEKNGIETRDMLPLLNQPIYKEIFGNIEDNYPISKWINNHGFYVGCHQYLGYDEIIYISKKIGEYIDELRNDRDIEG